MPARAGMIAGSWATMPPVRLSRAADRGRIGQLATKASARGMERELPERCLVL
jgi:hypothetical protein